ncbi:hypothetical protein GJU40_17525 [Bacillus lacus]|uniref:Uncharacterized protein n=1 Tax=Metabacillus lacus TaxID=1983721 RepID=A0A7X2J1W1_9BACI|nr:hypothetical protein [Metabacillus lacus]MRX73936.1 hypothetical protein [Metabacillus lacus]
MDNLVVPKISKDSTTDQELVQLAGLHAYLEYENDHKIDIEGKEFLVYNTNYDHPTGLDALTLKNENTGEFIIAFVGTDAHAEYGMQDLKTNVKLLNGVTPPQLQEANAYFQSMQAELAKSGHEISYVCGNSLGGALANSVAVQNPNVKSVTINPALLPSGMVVNGADYSNISNYISQYDILNLSTGAGKLDHRVPGNQFEIHHGIPSNDALVPNHTGYVRKDSQHVPYYESGEPGTVDYVKIYMDAHEHIVTSVWTGEPLYGGKSIPIKIDREQLLRLGSGLETRVLDRLKRTQTYIDSSAAIVKAEGSEIDQRLTALRNIFQGMLRKESKQLLNENNRKLREMVSSLHIFLDKLEVRCRSLNTILNSPPMELFEFLTKTDISVESICQEMRNKLSELEDGVDHLSSKLFEISMNHIAEVLKGGQSTLYDFVVGELESHLLIVQQNQEKAMGQVTEYQSQVVATGEKFHALDVSLSQQNRGIGALQVSDVQKTNTVSLEESPYMLSNMRIKQIAAEAATECFKTATYPLIIGLTNMINSAIIIMEALGETARFQIKTATNLGLYGNIPGLALSLFSDFDSRVKRAVNDALLPLEDFLETIKGIRKGMTALQENYPALITNLEPYINDALFNNSRFNNVAIYNTAALSILKDLQSLFDDIVYQLAHNHGKAIEALQLTGYDILQNMGKLESQLERGTLNG